MLTADHTDYITITTGPESTTEANAFLLERAHTLGKGEARFHATKSWGSHGYVGWCCGAVSFGRRADGYILRVSGPLSEHVARWVPEGGINVSRLDVAHTVWGLGEDYCLRGAIEQRARDSAADAVSPKQRRVGLIDSGDGAQTLTIGSRSSVQYGRVYNKGRESGDGYYEGAWRYEIEYKAPAAGQVAGSLPVGEKRVYAIAAHVGQWFGNRGVDVPYSLGIDPCAVVLPSRTNREDQATLEWFRKQVAPAVSRLICAGLESEVYSALGLVGPARRGP